MLAGDVNGDGRADFEIALAGGSSLDRGDLLVARTAAVSRGARMSRGMQDVLDARPLTPTDVDLFAPGAYPDAAPMAPAAGPPPTIGQVRAMLRDYLAAEFLSEPARRAEGMALFDIADLIAKIPNPSLRAALIGLMGTAGEPAIDFVLNAKTPAGLPEVEDIDFDCLPWDSDGHTYCSRSPRCGGATRLCVQSRVLVREPIPVQPDHGS